MNVELLVSAVRRRYSFLRDTAIDILIDGYGSTAYNARHNAITIYLGSLKANHRDKCYRKRFGSVSFSEMTVLALLHEVCHVRQWQRYGTEYMQEECAKIGWQIDHDDHPLEREADRFARAEFGGINKIVQSKRCVV